MKSRFLGLFPRRRTANWYGDSKTVRPHLLSETGGIRALPHAIGERPFCCPYRMDSKGYVRAKHLDADRGTILNVKGTL